MSHNIGQMFYYGDIPWHEKGREITHPATAKDALKFGGLDWEVDLIDIQTAEVPPTAITRRKAVVRTDKKTGDEGRVLGVVHPDFRPLQNREGIMLLDALLGEGKAIYHTGGYLGEGQVVWALARLPGEMKVRGNDIVEPYFLFSNSHDGTRAIDFRLTTIRVVCQNTLNLALSHRRAEFIFKQSHSIGLDRMRKQAKAFFDFAQKEINATENSFQKLANTSLLADDFQKYLITLLPLPKSPEPESSESVMKGFETRKKNIEGLRSGITRIYSEGYSDGNIFSLPESTLWGALNAVTTFVDHAQPLDVNDHYAYLMFGEGARLKETAYIKALEISAG